VEGHRGAGYLEPENSIKAFKKAIELGLDSVEFDVSLVFFIFLFLSFLENFPSFGQKCIYNK